MKRYPPLLLLTLVLTALSLSTGCDGASDESGTVTLMGQVLDAETNNPLANAFVRIVLNENLDEETDVLVETDAQGRFTVEVRVHVTTEVRIVATKDAFSTDTVTVLAIAGRTIEVPNFRLNRTRAEEPTSGSPSNILLVGQTHEAIGIIESGSVEVSRITFQVADSAGRPVTLENEAQVRFRFGQHPGGGEFIAPLQAPTDNSGKVTVNLSSGTRAGAVQVVAEADVEGRTIRSRPVSVAIHGGLPDQAHFTLGPDRFNFPGLLIAGLTNPVSVIVGDKYANPVKPGTVVYFTTSHGVIEGSVETNTQGRGSVNLISGNPLPADGVAIVEAETADDQDRRVTSRFPVLFSGFIVVRVEPAVARLGETYRLTVTDQNDNPLAAGTNINVRADGTKVKATGNTNVTLDDTIFTGFTYNDIVRGPGFTEFVFRAVEDRRLDEDGTPKIETITIRVSGPNGSLEVVLTAGGATTRTQGARVELLPGGQALIRASE